jgi:hypothetical protein
LATNVIVSASASQQAGDAGIVLRRAAGAARHAEGCKARALHGLAGEEFGIERICAGIAALDIIDAEIVEQARNVALVLEREIDAGGLRAVAQRRVEQIEAFACHLIPIHRCAA